MLQWRELVDYCEKNDIKLVAYSPLIKAKVKFIFLIDLMFEKDGF